MRFSGAPRRIRMNRTTAATMAKNAKDFGIERDAQDRMALRSQQRALAAQVSGFFDAEIVPVTRFSFVSL